MRSEAEKFTVIERLEDIPAFSSEDEEHAFWATHELSDALWDQAEPFAEGELPAAAVGLTILLGELTLKRAKAVARSRRVSYHSLIEELVTQGVSELEPGEVGLKNEQ